MSEQMECTCLTIRWRASSRPTGVRPLSQSPGISTQRSSFCSRLPRGDRPRVSDHANKCLSSQVLVTDGENGRRDFLCGSQHLLSVSAFLATDQILREALATSARILALFCDAPNTNKQTR